VRSYETCEKTSYCLSPIEAISLRVQLRLDRLADSTALCAKILLRPEGLNRIQAGGT
jgi:hypothetical protein